MWIVQKMSSQPAFRRLWLITWVVTIPTILAFIGAVPAYVGAALFSTPNYLPAVFQDWQTATPTPVPGYLLITEVMADPDGDEPAGEWIEIFNAGETTLDLSLYKIGDEEAAGGLEGMFQFPPGAMLLPGKAIVIANQTETFYRLFRLLPDYELYDTHQFIPDMVKYLSWSKGYIELSNSGDEVLILNEFDQRVDSLSWGTSRLELDPAPPAVAQGHSLERYPPNHDTDSAQDWRDQASPNPKRVDLTLPTPTPSSTPTPGVTPLPLLVINEIHADPHPDLGDANGDGVVNRSQDEFVEIVNITGVPIDLSGWGIYDAVGLRHAFPSGSLVFDQCAMVVFGGGQPAGDFGGSLVQTASTGGLGLNNDGDTLKLHPVGGGDFISYTYGAEGGDDQSLTRDPDISGLEPLVKHSTVEASGGALFSAGVRLDGSTFTGCGTRSQITEFFWRVVDLISLSD